MKNKKHNPKEYRTPQAVKDFIRHYRKQLLKEDPSLKRENLAENLHKLEMFLLKHAESLEKNSCISSTQQYHCIPQFKIL